MPQEKSQHGKRKGSASNGEPQMTKASRQAIIDSKFDFASVAGCMSDIRRSFWNLERTNEFYKKKIANLHSHFYQQIVPGRQEEREEMEKKLKRGGFISALKLIDNAKVGKGRSNLGLLSRAVRAPVEDTHQTRRKINTGQMKPTQK